MKTNPKITAAPVGRMRHAIESVHAKNQFDRLARGAQHQPPPIQRGNEFAEFVEKQQALTAREPQVLGQICDLERRLQDQEELLAQLENRLEGVLRPCPGHDGCDVADEKEVMAPCALRLNGLVARLSNHNRALERLLGWLEV